MKKQIRTDPDDWINRKWRPLMGYMYMVVCIFDFILFPVLWSIAQAWDHAGQVTLQWQPLTLQGAGLFHMAMGAVLGIAAYGRTKEKINGVGSDIGFSQNLGTTYQQPGDLSASQNYYRQPYSNAGMQQYGGQDQYGRSQYSNRYSPPVFMSRQGRPGPILEEPEL